ncbi:MAG: AAA family ATPase [Bacteroidia bacterium]|nr:AAA family ATPase [Bacteroidia bacterium]
MTVAELAKKIKTSPETLFALFERIQKPIPHELEFELSESLVSSAISIISPLEKNRKTEKVNIEEEISKIESNELKKLLALKSEDLIREIRELNNLQHLILSGKFKQRNETNNFGYFEDVLDTNGNDVYYPNLNKNQSAQRIREIFIFSPKDLEDGERYHFKCELANNKERVKQKNPYLLQTTSRKVKLTNGVNDIAVAIEEKQASLANLKNKIDFVKFEIEEKVKAANETLEEYNQRIKDEFVKIKEKEEEFSSLNSSFEETTQKILNMEILLKTLRDRVALCKNLQFISEDDESRYINLLAAKDFKPIDHLDFKSDFEESFSKLSDHIHAYLYHKKNLIYTRFQIRNFLTLLKTHDIIVLSGLSGSGKTQIVKAFAEAMGGIAKIIPVKPNWTSSEDLIGYYNPLQMSFLPTPFTEAIVEAIHNPNQLYFICLDEMNLARAEYYFADFLSKLEERSKLPEIELYANHEEELFISEFSTLLNLIESSIKGNEIKSWQEFLDNEVSRKRFYEMLGNTDKESILQLHAKMKRRLVDVLKFPSTIKIPDNVRFIGAINVDETTHYFSPKILDRIHIVKFENPLQFEENVNNWFEQNEVEKDLIPVYVQPQLLSVRKEFPSVNNSAFSDFTKKLKDINKLFLLPLNIDFGIRSIRQSLNYADLNKSTFDYGDVVDISLNTIILQKILPRFIFDGSETAKNSKSKMEVVEEFQKFLAVEFSEFYFRYESDETGIGKVSSEYLAEMIEQAKRNSNSQFNFFA